MTWRRYIPFWKPDVPADVDAEITFHLETRTRDLMRTGMDESTARAAAEREFGDASGIRSQMVTIDERRYRRAALRERIATAFNDLRIVSRSLRKTPGFTIVAVICVALGVGASTAIFSAVNAVLLRPLPYPEPEQLVSIYSRHRVTRESGVNISHPDYVSWRDENRTLGALGMWGWATYTISTDGSSERIEGARVTPNLFPLLGVNPVIGRHFHPSEAELAGNRTIMLSHALWRARFGGDSTIVGRSITIDGDNRLVVGVMPPNFRFPAEGVAWTPFVTPATPVRSNRMYAGALGRLRPGVTLEQNQQDLDRISAGLKEQFPRDNDTWEAHAVALRTDLVGPMQKPLTIFLGAVALVLLIACANVANLMLARGVSRRQEMAVRVALGAGRARVMNHVLAESFTVAALGGLLGIAIAYAGVGLIGRAFPNGAPFYIDLGIDRVALAFAAAITMGTALAFGIIPALDATRVDVQRALRDGARGGQGRARARLRSALVVGEIAMSVVLLVGASLLARSYQTLMSTDLGFRESGVLSTRVTLPARYSERAARIAFYEQVFARFGALPGVDAVGSAQGIPFGGWNVASSVTVEGKSKPDNEELDAHYQIVSPEFFRTIGVPVLRGRALTAADRDTTAPVGVINETFALREFPNDNPIGKRVKFGGSDSEDRWITIVGVMGDYRHYRLPQPVIPALYIPLFEEPTYSQTFVLHTTAPDVAALVPSMRAIVAEIDSNVPLYEVRTFEQAVSRSVWRERFQAQVIGVFALVALVLASAGIYGLVSWSVTQRTRELGVRMALGARRATVMKLVMLQGARLAAVGIAAGIVAAFALTRVLRTLLFGVTPNDALSFVVVAVALASVAVVASLIPAWRAAKVDPVQAIRTD